MNQVSSQRLLCIMHYFMHVLTATATRRVITIEGWRVQYTSGKDGNLRAEQVVIPPSFCVVTSFPSARPHDILTSSSDLPVRESARQRSARSPSDARVRQRFITVFSKNTSVHLTKIHTREGKDKVLGTWMRDVITHDLARRAPFIDVVVPNYTRVWMSAR